LNKNRNWASIFYDSIYQINLLRPIRGFTITNQEQMCFNHEEGLKPTLFPSALTSSNQGKWERRSQGEQEMISHRESERGSVTKRKLYIRGCQGLSPTGQSFNCEWGEINFVEPMGCQGPGLGSVPEDNTTIFTWCDMCIVRLNSLSKLDFVVSRSRA
jgi:hypothetical protein